MTILSLIFLTAGFAFLIWFFSNVFIAHGMIQTGRYRKVTVPMLPLLIGSVLAFLGLGFGLMSWIG